MATNPHIAARPRRDILVVDDDASIRRSLARLLSGEGFAIEIAHSGAAALAALDVADFSIALIDLAMHPMDGVDLIARIHARGLRTPVLLISGTPRDQIDRRLLSMVLVRGVVTKPWDRDSLLESIRTITSDNALSNRR